MNDITIRRVSDLIKDIEDGTLVLSPSFQRRLVWTNKVKDHFLETVALGLPFPEIFIATGEIDTETMKRKNLLVDGQQRISTLRQYVQSSRDLVLKLVRPYKDLSETDKKAFLDYKVAVRDLGQVSHDKIKDVFSRINSTNYALKTMERLNAQYDGEFKNFCEELSRDEFFERHGVFSMADFRRMSDLDFCVILTITLMSTYYHRDELNQDYLHRYNDEFPGSSKLRKEFKVVFEFIERCEFAEGCRVWKKTDLFTLIVELKASLASDKELDPAMVGKKLADFYSKVDNMYQKVGDNEDIVTEAGVVFAYLKAATKATNDKYSRVIRGEFIGEILTAASKVAKGGATRKNVKKK